MASAVDPRFRFAQINDLHMPGPALDEYEELDRERARRALWLIEALRRPELPAPDLILGIGDFVLGNDLQALGMELDHFASSMAGLPFYPVLGNHDYEQGDAETELRFMQACGQSALSYSFEHRGIAFIMLDNRPLSSSESSARRAAWLRTRLAKHGAAPKIICCHIPLVSLRDPLSMGRAGVEGYLPEDAADLRLIEDHAATVLAVLSGHLHLTGSRCARSIHHICVGGTATFPCDFALHTVYDDRLEVEIRQLPSDLVAAPATSGYAAERLGVELIDDDHPTNTEFIMGTGDERRFVIPMK